MPVDTQAATTSFWQIIVSVPDSWELASLLAKLLFYMGAFSIAGGSLCSWRYSNANRAALLSNSSYIFFGTVVGFHGALLGFLLQVGLINDSGIGGMFDWGMISILFDTAQGDVIMLRLLAFILAGASSVVFIKQLQHADISLVNPRSRLLFAVQAVALFGLAYSQTMVGHVSVLSSVARTSIALHFIAFSLWIGCCYPFLQLSRSLDLETLHDSLRRFGNNAVAILLVLFASALLMLLELLGSPWELIDSAYGLALSAKIALVLAIVGVAAMNKLVIVPSLVRSNSAAKLQTSLRYEIALAMVILIVTSYLSTIVGPVGHQM